MPENTKSKRWKTSVKVALQVQSLMLMLCCRNMVFHYAVKDDLENPALTFSPLETSTTQPKEIKPTPTGTSFAEAIKKYLADNQSSWGAKQFKSVEAKLNYFLDYAQEKDGLNPQQRV